MCFAIRQGCTSQISLHQVVQGCAGQGRAGQGRAGQGRAGQVRSGQGRAGQDKLSLSQNTGGISGIPQPTHKSSHQSRAIRSDGETGDILSERRASGHQV